METSDPDDAFTLCLLATHAQVNLRAVTITPGSLDQVKLVRYLLKLCQHSEIPIGVRSLNYPKKCVSEFHYKWLGKFEEDDKSQLGYQVLFDTFTQFPDCVLLTGASLGNPRMLLENYPEVMIDRWVGQGGFAGDCVVPVEHRLEKFNGKNTCATFNFNGDIPGAKLLLQTSNIKLKQLVSKNVCHGVVYNQKMHERIKSVKNDNLGLSMIYQGMSVYFKKNPDGKKFHDPLAACVAINSSICDFREVEVYREKGEWGSRLKNDTTNTFISISYNQEKFINTLTGK